MSRAKKKPFFPLERTIYLFGELDTGTTADVAEKLQAFAKEDPKKPVHLVINSEGGLIYEAFAIHDLMNSVSTPIYTYGIGTVWSAATLLLTAGEKRYVYPNTWIMLHEPLFGSEELKAGDLRRDFEHNQVLCKQMYNLYSLYTDRRPEQIAKDLEGRDLYMSAEEAVKYGLVDEVMLLKG